MFVYLRLVRIHLIENNTLIINCLILKQFRWVTLVNVNWIAGEIENKLENEIENEFLWVTELYQYSIPAVYI